MIILNKFLTRRQTLELPGSTVSLTTLEDVDDNSTAITEGPAVSELHNEETRQIYSTYFNEAANYDPDLPITSYLEQVHERDQEVDFGLLIVKKFLKLNSPRVKIYSVVNDVMKLELNVKDRSGIIHFLNKEIVEVGLAEPAEESFASKVNPQNVCLKEF
ncbi:uncharacterized protein [Parasteatoda tepidariorum]|uniref:uncharacterized protein n=1 Tax=Parasteatoda tepidariorum TaxID=114398 RepID=UPI0039BCF104